MARIQASGQPPARAGQIPFSPTGDAVEDAITWSRLAGSSKIARSQAVLDGVVLAVEQVQDARLALALTPKAVGAGELVLSMFSDLRRRSASANRRPVVLLPY
jgi:hypothetical protein